MSENDSIIENIAVHEAGHAVVARHLGFALKEIVVNEYEGHVRHSNSIDFVLCRDKMSDYEWIALEKEVQSYLAGEMAEKLILPFDRPVDDGGPASDREEIRFLVSKVFPDSDSEARQWVARLEKQTESLVANLREAIADLAYHLVDRRRLSGEEAARFLRERDSGPI